MGHERPERQVTIVAAVRYLGPVFALGWVLGPIRELVLVPRFGRTAANAMETPLMAAATYASARSIIRRLGTDTPIRTRLMTGAVAFGMLCALELIGARAVRRLSLSSYIATFRSPAGAIALAAFVWFACAPAVVERRLSR